MKNLTSGMITIVACALTLACGCAPLGKDLVQNRVVKVEEVSSKRAEVTSVAVYVGAGHTIVTGRIRKRLEEWGPIRGRLYVEVIGPDRKTLVERNIPYRSRFRSRVATFEIELPQVVPAGSLVRVTHHGAV